MSLTKRTPYNLFLAATTIIGGCLIGWGVIFDLPRDNLPTLILLILLAVTSSYVTRSMVHHTDGSITYEVGTAIGLAAVPEWGIGGAILVVFASILTVSLLKNWADSRLIFNVSMTAISISGAGITLLFLQSQLEPLPIVQFFAPWLLSAAVFSALNTILVITIIRLDKGSSINVLELAFEDQWATLVDIAIMCVGGLILAYAIQNYDSIGVIAFCLPILLSAFAFRVYVTKMSEHMNNLESIIEERTQSLKTLVAEKDHFLTVLTHDMKAPLTTINLYSSMLMQKPEALLKKPKIARAIFESQKNLADIVENILDLEKLNVDGEIDLYLETFDLVPLIESLVDTLSAQSEQKKIEVQTDLGGLTSAISADRSKISRVFQNIFSNAIKYTPENGQVHILGFIEAGTAIVQIQDTGYGIPKEDIPFIFERFKRVNSNKDFATGTGLGLAITKALVESHGGKVTVSSVPNLGSCFSVYIPLRETETIKQMEKRSQIIKT
ncbi:MAG: HAMP domain-containing sensor histidine kinase [Chloroflexota bacterium]